MEFMQYARGDSEVHRLNPVSKKAALVTFSVAVFAFSNILFQLGALAFVCLLHPFSGLSLRKNLWGLKFLLLFLPLLVVLHAFGFGLEFTYSGMISGIVIAMRLFSIVLIFCLFSNTTKPSDISNSLEKLRFPRAVSLIVGLSLQFVNIVFRDIEKIRDAQVSRGMELKARRLRDLSSSVKANAGILIPLLFISMERAEQQYIAMECRCVNSGRKRTVLNPVCFSRKDYAVIVASLILISAIIFL